MRQLNFDAAYSNLWGYLIADEPNYQSWRDDENEREKGDANLLLAYRTYMDHNNGKIPFFVLSASTGDDNIGPVPPDLDTSERRVYTMYYNYLQRIYDKVLPLMMSADFYPIANESEEDSDGKQVLYSIKKEYYCTLEAMGDFSRTNNVPFWLFMLSNKHTTYNDETQDNPSVIGYAYPNPTVGVLRLQAMTALAYGMQSIVFWTYSLGITEKYYKISNNLREKYYNAPFVNGHTTQIWNNCKTVISEVKQFGNILLGAKFQSARHVCSPSTAAEYQIERFGRQFGCIAYAQSFGIGYVITHLKKGDDNYMAIVSHDFTNAQQIQLILDNSYDWSEIKILSHIAPAESQLPSKAATKPNEELTRINTTLSPGGMILLKY